MDSQMVGRNDFVMDAQIVGLMDPLTVPLTAPLTVPPRDLHDELSEELPKKCLQKAKNGVRTAI